MLQFRILAVGVLAVVYVAIIVVVVVGSTTVVIASPLNANVNVNPRRRNELSEPCHPHCTGHRKAPGDPCHDSMCRQSTLSMVAAFLLLGLEVGTHG